MKMQNWQNSNIIKRLDSFDYMNLSIIFLKEIQ